MTRASRASRDCARTLLVLLLASGCGGSSKPPSHAEDRTKRDRAARDEAEAEKAKASRMARLDSSDLAERAPESVVQVTLEPLVTGVRSGRKFLLAAHFRIAPGYRVSWTNPGDVGKETVVTVSGPADFEVGSARFPVPEKYTVPGGYVGFGYQNEMAVFVEVKAPAVSRSAVHRFDLSASWVACKKECSTEHTDAFVELTTASGNTAAKDVEARLAPFKARLPTPLADVKDADQKWEHTARRSTLLVNIPGTEVRDFWPGTRIEPAPKKVDTSGDQLRIAFDGKPGEKPIGGLVIASENGKDAFFELEVRSPDAEPKSPGRSPTRKAVPRRIRR